MGCGRGPNPITFRATPEVAEAIALERDEFRFALRLNNLRSSPRKRGPRGRELGQRTGSPLPRGRTEISRRFKLSSSRPSRDAGADIWTQMCARAHERKDRKSTRLNSSHMSISYAVFCLK